MDDYARLKWADDPRWTNARKRGTLKALAETGGQAAETGRQSARAKAITGRLAAAKRSVAALRVSRMAVGDVAGLMADAPAAAVGDRRAAYERMGSADAVERSLWATVTRYRELSAACVNRVATKVARIARLQTRVMMAVERRPRDGRATIAGPTTAVAATEKTVDALRLANRQAAWARDAAADNVTAYAALNAQLAGEVRQQAAVVAELLAYGTEVQRQVAAYDAKYCRAVAERDADARNNAIVTRCLNANMAILESTRKKAAANAIQREYKKNDEFHISETAMTEYGISEIDYNHKSYISDENDVMPLMEWIDNGPMESHMYRKNKSVYLANDTMLRPSQMIDSGITLKSDNISTASLEYTYPEDKINLFKSENYTRAMEAAEYVCDTLRFSDVAEVLRYISTVKTMEKRVRKMISARKHLSAMMKRNLECAAELDAVHSNCVPESILALDGLVERVRRDGLEAQRKRLCRANREIAEYGALFNELWFQLDNLSGKLDRCQVPVVRKYQVYWRNQTECTNTMKDARRMFKGLRLTTAAGFTEDDGDDEGGNKMSTPCDRIPETASVSALKRSEDGLADVTTSGWQLAVDACRKLVAKVHAKVKTCMVHMGDNFDPSDDRQQVARAYFAYKQQCQIQDAVLVKKNDQNRMSRQGRRPKAEDRNLDDSATARARTVGILTREQAKQQADEIVRWCLMPKDADEKLRSRKPISFRKSRIVV